MMIGILADTHGIDKRYVKMVADDLLSRGAGMFLIPGDFTSLDHFDPNLFGNKPVVCALVDGQHPKDNKDFVFAPPNWHFTLPGVVDPKDVIMNDPVVTAIIDQFVKDPEVRKALEDRLNFRRIIDKMNIANRIVDLGVKKAYVGHRRSHDLLTDIIRAGQFMQEVNEVSDGVSLICTAHTHRKFLIQRGNMTWVNPGAVMIMPASVCPADGYEYVLFNTENNEVVFCRIPVEPIPGLPETVGIVADTGNITQLHAAYWENLALEFRNRGTSHVIMCGNHWHGDIGRRELDGMEVYYNLLPQQSRPGYVPGNWHQIDPSFPLVDICGNTFFIQYDLRAELDGQPEYSSLTKVMELSRQFPNRHIDFVLCGQSNDAILEEGDSIMIIAPGDARNKRSFVTVCLPEKRDITFSRVPINAK